MFENKIIMSSAVGATRWEIKDNQFLIYIDDRVVQTLPCPDPSLTGFGKQVILELPFMFIAEPFAGTGKVWVYKWTRVRSRYYQFRLATKLVRPSQTISPQNPAADQALGFGRCLSWHAPFLFITDTTYPNFHGSLFVYCTHRTDFAERSSDRANNALKLAYSHTSSCYDEMGYSLKVSEDGENDDEDTSANSSDLLKVDLGTVHRLTGDTGTVSLKFLIQRKYHLEVLPPQPLQDVDEEEGQDHEDE